MQEEKPKKVTKSGKNLILLGLGATLIAALTTGVSLAIYHNSGDIYLDRSRPGFLPDEEEIEQKDNNGTGEVYDFSKRDGVTEENLTEYLEEMELEIQHMKDIIKIMHMKCQKSIMLMAFLFMVSHPLKPMPSLTLILITL